MVSVVCIADDLTGANANGVQLVQRGFRVETVLTGFDASLLAKSTMDALIHSTDSRALSANDAYRVVHEAVCAIKPAPDALVSKRIDSTLRGNIGAETDAVLDALADDRLAVVVPCFPSAGRSTIGGNLYVHGVPLPATEAANDPLASVDTASVATIFSRQTKRAIAEIHVDEVRDADALHDQFIHLQKSGQRIVICDAETEGDIEKIAQTVNRLPFAVVAVDPGVFTAALASHRFAKKTAAQNQKHVLAVIGSVNPVAAEQVRMLAEQRKPNLVEVVTKDLLSDALYEAEIARVVAALASSTNPYLVVVGDGIHADKRIDLDHYDAICGGQGEASERINKGFATIAARLLAEKPTIIGLLTTGGDITKATYRELSATRLALTAEIVPLGSYGHLVDGKAVCLPVITKGGMVGAPDALITCLDYFFTTN